MSGACTTKTCWKQLQPFTTVAKTLGGKYRRAVKIKDINSLLEHSSTTRVQPVRGAALKQRGVMARPRRLVYLNDSPDFCQANSTAGKNIIYAKSHGRTRRLLREIAQTASIHNIKTVHIAPHPPPGWPGTAGRRCSRRKGDRVTAAESRSCKTLCRDCNLSVNKSVSKVVVPCHCRFQWCCKVKCDNCLRRKVTLSCSERRDQ